VSTNRVNVEFDYFTAVDDLQPKQDPGAGMIGTIEFNSACYYRYASVDMRQLTKNLQDDQEQAHKALRAFIQAMIEAVPTGKQNTFAAHNPPSLIAVVVRDAGQWNLVNAFAKPVAPKGEQSMIDLSIAELDKYWGSMTSMYGTKRLRGAWVVSNETTPLPHLAPTIENSEAAPPASAVHSERVHNVDTLVERVMTAVQGSTTVGAA
jgi:CRISPR system Cascade subunit CasC